MDNTLAAIDDEPSRHSPEFGSAELLATTQQQFGGHNDSEETLWRLLRHGSEGSGGFPVLHPSSEKEDEAAALRAIEHSEAARQEETVQQLIGFGFSSAAAHQAATATASLEQALDLLTSGAAAPSPPASAAQCPC